MGIAITILLETVGKAHLQYKVRSADLRQMQQLQFLERNQDSCIEKYLYNTRTHIFNHVLLLFL